MKPLLLMFLLLGGSLSTAWACHQGGPMGFASENPGMFSVDLTLSPTFAAASTSGTSGCQQWHYAQEQDRFLETQWEQLAQESAQGGGPHLIALSRLMGCSEVRWTEGLREMPEFFLAAQAPAGASDHLRHQAQQWNCRLPHSR